MGRANLSIHFSSAKPKIENMPLHNKETNLKRDGRSKHNCKGLTLSFTSDWFNDHTLICCLMEMEL